MRVDFRTVLIDVRDNTPLQFERPKKGEYVKNEDGSDKVDARGNKIPVLEWVDLTLQYAAGESLGMVMPGEGQETQEVKLKRGKLIEKIYLRPECDLTVEQAALIKERISKCYGPLVVVAVENLLERKDEKASPCKVVEE